MLNQRRNKKGIRTASTGAAKHKFDADAHAARKAGKNNKAEKVRGGLVFEYLCHQLISSPPTHLS